MTLLKCNDDILSKPYCHCSQISKFELSKYCYIILSNFDTI